ncbi:nucleoside-diphosphate kinase [Acanthopleuribacter pedis]|uniref:Nucleoside diphosphate kinase n=1 Tax=Acanthopleuribacter pedis TaxID=442870 RepID=A0A8J7QAZ9_9BACT|nr:nucleoside-diphosphate kinase [Acanthopleuribacter pedis]
MSLQRTFAVIKPDAVADGNTGNILAEIEANGFKIVAMKKMQLTQAQAEGFYHVHKERPFFGELVTFMTEGPIVALILEKEDAIPAWRKLMGATNPEQAEEGTLRKKYGASIERNATHGSDAEETAAFETRYFFNAMETV